MATKADMHVMIDIETLGTRQNAMITQIAAVPFELAPDGVIDIKAAFNTYVRPYDEGTIDLDTLQFWTNQPRDAFQKLINRITANGVPIRSTLVSLNLWFAHLQEHEFEIQGVWANGTVFDLGILSSAFERLLNQPAPWHFRAPRDMRTFFDIFNHKPEVVNDNLHDAIYDCEAQIKQMQRTLAHGLWSDADG